MFVGIIHSDAGERSASASHRDLLRAAPDMASAYKRLLAIHGPTVARLAPRLYGQLCRAAATQSLLAGYRAEGIRDCLLAFPHCVDRLTLAAVLALGLLDPRVLAWAKAARRFAIPILR